MKYSRLIPLIAGSRTGKQRYGASRCRQKWTKKCRTRCTRKSGWPEASRKAARAMLENTVLPGNDDELAMWDKPVSGSGHNFDREVQHDFPRFAH